MDFEVTPNKWTITNLNMQMRFNALIKVTVPRSSSVYQKYKNGLGEGPVWDYFDLDFKQYCIKTIIYIDTILH